MLEITDRTCCISIKSADGELLYRTNLYDIIKIIDKTVKETEDKDGSN